VETAVEETLTYYAFPEGGASGKNIERFGDATFSRACSRNEETRNFLCALDFADAHRIAAIVTMQIPDEPFCFEPFFQCALSVALIRIGYISILWSDPAQRNAMVLSSYLETPPHHSSPAAGFSFFDIRGRREAMRLR
jgi:hypothetical protein